MVPCGLLGDDVQIEQHVEVLMHDFAACVLMELQQGMLEMSLTSMSLSTPIDEPSFSGHLGITDDTSKRLGSEDVCLCLQLLSFHLHVDEPWMQSAAISSTHSTPMESLT